MDVLKELVTRYWPDIVSFGSVLVSYFLLFLYRYSTRNLNSNLKTVFKENSNILLEENKLFESRVDYALKEARDEYLEAVKLCESYKKRIEHLEKTLNAFLHDGGEE